MCPFQHVIIVMNRESCRHPFGFGGMAELTIIGDPDGQVVGIGTLIIGRSVASHACIGGVVVVTGMAVVAIVGKRGMGTGERIKIVVVFKKGRDPVGGGGMACGTIVRQACNQVVGVGTLIKIFGVAIETNRGCAGIPLGMAFEAVGGGVCPCQWEIGSIVVEAAIRFSVGVAFKTGRAAVLVTAHTFVLIIHLGLVVIVAGDTGELYIAGWVFMTFTATDPFTVVAAGVYREILGIVQHEFGWFPAGLCRMAFFTVGGDVGCIMIGIA